MKTVLFVGDTMQLRHAASQHIKQVCGESVSLALGSINDEKQEDSWRPGESWGYAGGIVQLFGSKPAMPWGLIRILALKATGVPVVGYVLTEDNLPPEIHQFVIALAKTLAIPIKIFSIELTEQSFGILISELEALISTRSA